MVMTPVTGDPTLAGAVWYWNYQVGLPFWAIPYPITFVPCAKDVAKLNDLLKYGLTHSPPPLLFTFNEPDVPTSTCYMDMMQLATRVWPQIMSAKAKKVVCPAMTKRLIIPYLNKFFQGNATYKPYCDYINVHFYDTDPFALLWHLDTVYAQWGKAIYVSEFGMADWLAAKFGRPITWKSADVQAFIKVAIAGMESRSWVFGYSYYSRNDVVAQEFGSLWNNDRTLRPAGFVYAGLPPNTNSSRGVGETDLDTSPNSSGTISKTMLMIAVFVPIAFCLFIGLLFYVYRRFHTSAAPIAEAISEEEYDGRDSVVHISM
jgi:hypothetical protein